MPLSANIYQNPLVPHGYYWLKLVAVHTSPSGMDRPLIQVQMQARENQGAASGQMFWSIIYPSKASRWFYLNFTNAFRIRGNNYDEAVGRWASVELYPAQWRGTSYSAVKYTYQPQRIRLGAAVLEREDKVVAL